MNRKDIIAMAQEAGFTRAGSSGHVIFHDELERFATLVAAAEQKKWFDQTEVEINEAVLDEREACAKVCDEESMEERDDWAMRRIEACARVIRARSNT